MWALGLPLLPSGWMSLNKSLLWTTGCDFSQEEDKTLPRQPHRLAVILRGDGGCYTDGRWRGWYHPHLMWTQCDGSPLSESHELQKLPMA